LPPLLSLVFWFSFLGYSAKRSFAFPYHFFSLCLTSILFKPLPLWTPHPTNFIVTFFSFLSPLLSPGIHCPQSLYHYGV
jgi:hypothetical protein